VCEVGERDLMGTVCFFFIKKCIKMKFLLFLKFIFKLKTFKKLIFNN